MANLKLLAELMKGPSSGTGNDPKRSLRESVAAPKTAPVKPRKKTLNIKENFVIFEELDAIVETAMRESLKRVINENSANDMERAKYTKVVDDSKFTRAQVLNFMKEQIYPTLKLIGLSKPLPAFNTSRSHKSVPVICYEVALTLEAARLRRLSEESLEVLPSGADSALPGVEDVEDVLNGVSGMKVPAMDETTWDPKDEAMQAPADKIGEREAPMQTMESYMMEDGSAEELTDVHQYDDQSDSDYDQKDVEFQNAAAIKSYEGETAGDPANGLFEPPLQNDPNKGLPEKKFSEAFASNNGGGINTILNKLAGHYWDEQDETSSAGVEKNKPDTAGEPEADRNRNSEFKGEDETLAMEEQVVIAKYLLGRIFNEYGVKNQNKKRAIVMEAVHYLTKYGIGNLFPNISDSIDLVTFQNTLSEKSTNQFHSVAIMEGTKIKRTPLQEARCKQKVVKALKTVAKKRKLIAESKGANIANKIAMKDSRAILESAKANDIENRRRAFRLSMSAFHPEAKNKIVKQWKYVETAMSNAALDMAKNITVGNYIKEGTRLVEFLKVLKENSPVYRPILRKDRNPNDNMLLSVLVTENATVWRNLNKKYCAKQRGLKLVECKCAASKVVKEQSEQFVNLCNSVSNTKLTRTALGGISNGWDRLNRMYNEVYRKLQSK